MEEDTPTPPPSPPAPNSSGSFRAIPIETIHLTKTEPNYDFNTQHDHLYSGRSRDHNSYKSASETLRSRDRLSRGPRETPFDSTNTNSNGANGHHHRRNGDRSRSPPPQRKQKNKFQAHLGFKYINPYFM